MSYKNESDKNFENEQKEDISVEILNKDIYEHVDVITDIIFNGKTDVTLKDLNYMCKYISKYEGCEDCPINCGRNCPFVYLLKEFGGNVSSLNNTVLKWLWDNPPKSFLMDIKQKMPNIVLNKDYNIPNFCVQNLYGKECCKCEINDNSEYSCDNMLCRKCWRQPMEKNN